MKTFLASTNNELADCIELEKYFRRFGTRSQSGRNHTQIIDTISAILSLRICTDKIVVMLFFCFGFNCRDWSEFSISFGGHSAECRSEGYLRYIQKWIGKVNRCICMYSIILNDISVWLTPKCHKSVFRLSTGEPMAQYIFAKRRQPAWNWQRNSWNARAKRIDGIWSVKSK